MWIGRVLTLSRRAPRIRMARALPISIALGISLASPLAVLAGGAGRDVPPFVLPVRATEERVILQTKMVCVADPAIECDSPYLDAKSASVNTDGGTFRSASCPGGPPAGACRPDYIAGAEITGELVVAWTITRTPQGFCGPSPAYEICHSGNVALNVTAPGVTVSNPLIERSHLELGENECICIDEPAFDSDFDGAIIADYWRTRNVEATCDIALEHAEDDFLPRTRILGIGQEAFPALLCAADASGACTVDPVVVLVEPDGTLTKGCGSPPNDTFTIRFARRNEPVAFTRRDIPVANFRDVGDVDGDGLGDLFGSDAETLYVNQGRNLFTATPTGLPNLNLGPARLVDWTDDGDVDLVARSGTSLNVYPGDTTGTFDPTPIVEATGLSTSGSQLKSIDHLNGDDRPDALYRTTFSSTIYWNETGGAVPPSSEGLGFAAERIVDLDGDGLNDLVGVTSLDPIQIVWAENAAPGGFSSSALVDVPTAAGDLSTILGQEIVDTLRCDDYTSNCCEAHGGLGCDDAACESIVCGPSDVWNDDCAEDALEQCAVCMPAGQPDCCVERPGQTGCAETACQDIVCAIDPNCCGSEWDRFCADEARGRCNQCFGYSVQCFAEAEDVDAADADGDGDVDLFVSIGIDLDYLHSQQDRDEDVAYFAWLENLQVDDPGASGGQPLFDPATSPWRLLGRAATSGSSPNASPIQAVDLDGDGDPDVVGAGSWYRNQSGSFTGPFGLGLGSPDQGCGVDGLRALWRLNADATDATGCDNDGTLQGPVPAPDLAGNVDAAYAFDGLDDVIDAGADASLDPGLPLGFSAWIRHDCPGLCRVFTNDVVSGASYTGFWVNITAGGLVAAGFGDGTGAGSSDRRSAESGTALTPNVWHHVVVTVEWPNFPSSNPNFDIYIDGSSVGVSSSGSGGAIAYAGNAALIGATSAGAAPFEGTLDDVRLYDRFLDAFDVAAIPPPDVALSKPPLATAEFTSSGQSVGLDQLIVEDIDDDGDADVLADEVLWEAVPEPGLILLLASGVSAIALTARARGRRGR